MTTPLLKPRNSTMYGIGITNTFRLNSKAILKNNRTGFPGWGTNLQNIEKMMRKIYGPDWLKKFLQADQSGAEALIVAYLAKPGKFRDLFKFNVKPHVYVALHLFKKECILERPDLDFELAVTLEPNVLTAHPQWKTINQFLKDTDDSPAERRYYYMAKQTCHSANYGIRGPTFQLNTLKKSEGKIALTRQQADYFLSFYRAMFPEIVAWNNETRDIVRATLVLRNLFGHPRQFTGDPNNSSFDQEAYAFVPQSTVAEITHRAYRDLQNYIEVNTKNWDLLANTHDSYLVQCLIEEELECAKMMKIFMEQELTGRDGVKFRMKSEVQSGFNWAPWKEGYNESGLREIKGL